MRAETGGSHFEAHDLPPLQTRNHKDPTPRSAIRIQQCFCMRGHSCHSWAQKHSLSYYTHEFWGLPRRFHSAPPHPHKHWQVSTLPHSWTDSTRPHRARVPLLPALVNKHSQTPSRARSCSRCWGCSSDETWVPCFYETFILTEWK